MWLGWKPVKFSAISCTAFLPRITACGDNSLESGFFSTNEKEFIRILEILLDPGGIWKGLFKT